MIVILLKISKTGLRKQAELCSGLINALRVFISQMPPHERFINEVREKVNKIFSIVGRLTYIIGGLDNTSNFVKNLMSKIPTNKNPFDAKEILLNKLEEFINTKIATKEIIANNVTLLYNPREEIISSRKEIVLCYMVDQAYLEL
jgi:hypothetical protein